MPPSSPTRIRALDRMRGWVMLLMTLDHASQFWNAGRRATDSAYFSMSSLSTGPIDGAQFWTRFVTHLCAPSFLFLVGVSLALSLPKRAAREAAWRIDLHLVIRAAVLFACEALLSLAAGEGIWILQVLYAIAVTMLVFIPLRRLPAAVVVGAGLAWLAVGEAVTRAFYPLPEAAGMHVIDGFGAALLAPGIAGSVVSLYPALHWASIAAIGWGFGTWLRSGVDPKAVARRCLHAAFLCALAFVAIRLSNSYGNMGVRNDGSSLLRWLSLSKYPPSLSFLTCQGSLLFFFLAYFFWRDGKAAHAAHAERDAQRGAQRGAQRRRSSGPLLVFGQTALFYYMAHFFVIASSLLALGYSFRTSGLRETYLAAFGCALVLYPLCLLYRRAKRRWPRSPLQYL